MAEAAADFRRVSFDLPGGRMAGVAFGRDTPNPDIVFLHATGFNARAYRTLLAPLGERFHVLALDLRGHGRTTLPARTFRYNSWRPHRDDVIALLERHVSAPVCLAGHSMGATVSLLVGGKRNDLVASLALIDPVIVAPDFAALIELPLGPLVARHTLPLARNAAKRSNYFPDRETAVRGFKGRGVFRSFPDEAIEDYVADGLVEDAKGGFRLACAPSYEAATFCAQRHDPWIALRAVTDPIVLLRAERDSTISTAALHRFEAVRPSVRAATIEGASHMLPMERPDRVRSAIETATLMGKAGRKFSEALE